MFNLLFLTKMIETKIKEPMIKILKKSCKYDEKKNGQK